MKNVLIIGSGFNTGMLLGKKLTGCDQIQLIAIKKDFEAHGVRLHEAITKLQRVSTDSINEFSESIKKIGLASNDFVDSLKYLKKSIEHKQAKDRKQQHKWAVRNYRK